MILTRRNTIEIYKVDTLQSRYQEDSKQIQSECSLNIKKIQNRYKTDTKNNPKQITN